MPINNPAENFSIDYGNEVPIPKTVTKKASVAKASANKQQELDWRTSIIKGGTDNYKSGIVDADGVYINAPQDGTGNKINPAGQEEGRFNQPSNYSMDAWETSGKNAEWFDNENNAEKIEKQRRALSGLLGKEASYDDVFAMGDAAKDHLIEQTRAGQLALDQTEGNINVNEVDPITGATLRKNLSVPQEGPVQPLINTSYDDRGMYKRPLISAQNPYTGEDLVAAMNTPEINAAFNTKYNKEGRKDYNKRVREEELTNQKIRDKLQSDPNAVMSDEFANTIPGEALNVVGAVASGGGRLTNAALSAPEFVSEGTSKVLDTIKEDFEHYLPEFSKKVKEAYKGSLAEDLVETVKYDANLVTKELDTFGNWLQEGTNPLYHRGNQQTLESELSADYEANEGFTNVARAMIKTAANNPLTAGETFIESLPEMMALAKKGVKGSGAFIALVGDRVSESEKTFKKEHDREPDASEYAKMVGAGVLAVGIDKVESKFILDPLSKTKLGKIIDNEGIDVLKKATKAISDSKLGKVVSKVPYGKTVAKGTAAGATEPAQEGTQTYLEEVAGKQTKESLTSEETKKKTAVGAGMGIGAGAVGGAGVQA
ncbi:MAG: hypothetical protein DRJ15_17085, partial [Bacteroidetes bacterium]